ncbi:nifR3 family TIM-barrel protein [Rhizobium beringeri]
MRNRVVLAPMSGVTDMPFRELAWRFGAGLVVTEMVASRELVNDTAESWSRLRAAGFRPHMVQLAGREAHWMAEAAKIAADHGADIIDINMGCPAKKVIGGYSGSALMRDPDHALGLIEATVKAVDIPVTLKMRLGWDENSINAPDIARRAEAAGIQLVTIHGRTRMQFYEGRADWDAIRAVREVISIPLIANGDVETAGDAQEILRRSARRCRDDRQGLPGQAVACRHHIRCARTAIPEDRRDRRRALPDDAGFLRRSGGDPPRPQAPWLVSPAFRA